MENNNKPRLRDLAQAHAMLKELDSETALSRYALRRIFLSGEVPTIEIGKRRLVNFDLLLKYLGGEPI